MGDHINAFFKGTSSHTLLAIFSGSFSEQIRQTTLAHRA
jgi:hypothetical protein